MTAPDHDPAVEAWGVMVGPPKFDNRPLLERYAEAMDRARDELVALGLDPDRMWLRTSGLAMPARWEGDDS